MCPTKERWEPLGGGWRERLVVVAPPSAVGGLATAAAAARDRGPVLGRVGPRFAELSGG